MLPFMEHAVLLILHLAFFRDSTLSFNNLTFQLLPLDRNHDLLLEKWNLGLCRNVIKELKNLELKVI